MLEDSHVHLLFVFHLPQSVGLSHPLLLVLRFKRDKVVGESIEFSLFLLLVDSLLISFLSVTSLVDVNVSSDFIIVDLHLLNVFREIVVCRLNFLFSLINGLSQSIAFSEQCSEFSLINLFRCLCGNNLLDAEVGPLDERGNFLLFLQDLCFHSSFVSSEDVLLILPLSNYLVALIQQIVERADESFVEIQIRLIFKDRSDADLRSRFRHDPAVGRSVEQSRAEHKRTRCSEARLRKHGKAARCTDFIDDSVTEVPLNLLIVLARIAVIPLACHRHVPLARCLPVRRRHLFLFEEQLL